MEQDFIDIWKQRDSYLDEVPGFKSSNLLQGDSSTDDYILFSSHSIWDSAQAFENWTNSEFFQKAHVHAGVKTKYVYLEPPQLECFTAVI